MNAYMQIKQNWLSHYGNYWAAMAREQQFSTERGSYIHDIYNEDKIANQIIPRMFTTNKYRFCKNNSEDEMTHTVGGGKIYL
jgi:hypothetical protein